MKYPSCKKVDVEETFFGISLEDPYAWLKAAKDPEVLDWVKRENAYTDAWFDQKEIEEKVRQLKEAAGEKVTYRSISPWRGGYAATRIEDGCYSLVRLNAAMEEEAVIVGQKQIEGFTPFELKVCPADSDKIAIYGLYDGAARPAALIVDMKEKRVLAKAENTFSCTWSRTAPVFYYSDTISDAATQQSHSRVMGYQVLTGETVCIYKDSAYSVFGTVQASTDDRFLMMEMMSDYSHARFIVYEEATGKTVDITESRSTQMQYVDSMQNQHFFISKETSSFGEVLAVENGQGLSAARVVRAEEKEVLDSGFVLGEKLYLMAMADVRTRILCIEDGRESVVALPEEIGTAGIIGRLAEGILLQFESFTCRPMTLAFDGEQMKVLHSEKAAEHPDLIVEQRFAPSVKDGRQIPYFMVYKKGTQRSGQNPVWMYGYGGYNSAMLPGHKEAVSGLDIADWAEKGGIYVLCSLRGGSEYGTGWHEEGMGMKKKNCYYDFIGITEQIIRDGWTAPEHIAISGCSNGGLLMSTLVTMRPDLFGCVIDSVPHTDMIHFAEDDRGPMYITEYGNPRESREMFEYMLSYSPYHNVKKVNYPSIYIQTGECDNNVPPYHGKKFAARMQECNQSENPVLLRVLAKGSHDRGSGEVYWRTIAEMQLFAQKALGL